MITSIIILLLEANEANTPDAAASCWGLRFGGPVVGRVWCYVSLFLQLYFRKDYLLNIVTNRLRGTSN